VEFGSEIIFAFEYDAASNGFRPADLSDKPPRNSHYDWYREWGQVSMMAQKRD
jgi:hypothetical protein